MATRVAPPTRSVSACDDDKQVCQFGTPEALQHVRQLTDVGSMTRLLHECIAYQRSLDSELQNILSQRTDLDKQLSILQKSSQILDTVKADADYMLSNICATCVLADQVSGKVRELDLAQSRVNETLFRTDAIVERGNCIDRAHKALELEDYESAAKYVQTFLDIDAKFKESVSDQRDQLLATKKQLEEIVRKRLSAAVDQRDHPTIIRFVRILSPLRLEFEGLQVYVSYLKKVVGMRSRLEFDHLVELMEQTHGDKSRINFVGCLTNLFKDIVLAVEENTEILHGLCGEDGIVYAICELQEECDSKGSLILKKYMDYRKLRKLTSDINFSENNMLSVGGTEGPDPREVELYLEEMLSIMQLGEDYLEFMLSKIKGMTSVSPELVPQASKSFRSGSFNKVVQDFIGYYVILEGFFMVENVRKAISIDENVPDSLTTSMVDDVFYVLQSCCRRAISTSNINSVIAVLTGAMGLLSNEYQEALQQKMREPNIGAKLFLGGAGLQNTGIDIINALNNMDVSSEYVLKLHHEVEEQCTEVFRAQSEREKVKSCLSEMWETSERLKRLVEAGMEQVVGAVAQRIRPVLDKVGGVRYETSEEEEGGADRWVERVMHAVETNCGWLRPGMTPNNHDMLVHKVMEVVARRLEVALVQKRYTQLGALQLDRDAAALVAFFAGMTQRTVRDKFARITQISTILNLDKVDDMTDFWGAGSLAGPIAWRLTPSEVRRVLGLRVGFRPDSIAALKL